jgi:hypothetical protein
MMQVDFEAFPDEQTIYGVFEPVERQDNSSYYEIEIPRDELTFAKFLRKLRPNIDLETPMSSYRAFARDTLTKNLGSCYCDQSNLSNIIELYQNRVITPEKEFPGAGEGERSGVYHDLYPGVGEAFITENIRITKDTQFQERLIKGDSNTTIKFYYKGAVE